MTTGLPSNIAKAAQAWLRIDPDASTRALLQAQLSDAQSGSQTAIDELIDEFSANLSFGTAGLRAAMGPGPNRMNSVVVAQTAAGLASWFIDRGLCKARIVIGHDARHKSAQFALESARILRGAGLDVLYIPGPAPTPLVAFGIRYLKADGAIVVTASHNPAADNGYKVYLGDGSQIIPPHDETIQASINAVRTLPPDAFVRSSDVTLIDRRLPGAYARRVATMMTPDQPRHVWWAYSPIHGVGYATMQQVLAATKLPLPYVVDTQRDPDPDFPTVRFPNPEEPGAMDLLLELAEHRDCDVAIATDPDADRCAIAIPTDHGWRQLTGDQLGSILAFDMVRRGAPGVLARSVVSGTQIDAIGQAAGVKVVTTLTGFKWIGRVHGLGFGYEEAIGYCCDPDAVADKDGISATVAVLSLVAKLRAQGRTMAELIDEIDASYGVYQTSQLAYRVADTSVIAHAMEQLRANPPSEIMGQQLVLRDLSEPHDDLPGTDAMEFTGDDLRFVVRPSGTEPKLKCYLQVSTTPADPARPSMADELASQRAYCARQMAGLRTELADVLANYGLAAQG